jgi:hypothetical protein
LTSIASDKSDKEYKMNTKLTPTTKLERNVAKWAKASGNAEGALNDLLTHGCQSGIVPHLIYYRDTVKFYRQHRKEIDGLLYELMESCGEKSPAALFGDKWDELDPFARDEQNQNLLAWFGFEEAARPLAGRAGIEA